MKIMRTTVTMPAIGRMGKFILGRQRGQIAKQRVLHGRQIVGTLSGSHQLSDLTRTCPSPYEGAVWRI
jgi:hypothetical protein